MPGITRRRLAAGVASAAIVAGRRASAQVPEVTRSLPRTYSGTRLNLAWGTGQVNVTMADFSREFTEATGINLQFTSLNSDDLQQKTILDTATKTNAYDVYLNAYQWKQEIGPYLADLTDMDKHVNGCPPLDLDDFPEAPFGVYSRFGNKLMAIPINGSATCFVWNKKTFRDAGLDPDAAPKSWQEVYDHGSKLVAGKQYGFNRHCQLNLS
jgi:multiple sugar transport system substrate-binding protein